MYHAFHASSGRALYYIAMITIFVLMQNTMKMIYAEPRPYWVTSDIKIMKCHAGFGNPSGHAMIGTGIPLIFWLDFMHNKCKDNRCAKYCLSFVLFVLVAAIAISTDYSRLILGVHSLN